MRATPFISRVLHQLRTEWKHQSWLVLGWLVWLGMRHWLLHASVSEGLMSGRYLGQLIGPVTALLAALLTWRCISADPPSNTDSFSLARPVGQQALFFGKLLFLAISVFIPLWLLKSRGWTGFGLGAGQWLALSGGVMLSVGLGVGLLAGITALAASPRQVIAIAILGAVGGGAWLVVSETLRGLVDPQHRPALEQVNQQICGSFVASVVVFVGSWAAWWTATVLRRRARALGLLLGALAFAPLLSAVSRLDWITPPNQHYANAAKLSLKTGKADPEDKTPGRGLWPTLRIVGLGRDEVASIIDFAPIKEGAEWPPLGSYTDLPANTRGWTSWIHHEHAKALFKHSPPTTLWNDALNSSALFNGRASLKDAIKPLRLTRETAISTRWRLRLAIHEMRRIATMPFRQLWTQPNQYLVRSGLRLEMKPFAWKQDAWVLGGGMHSMSAMLLPERPQRAAHARGRDLEDNFFLVLEDPELRENKAQDLGISAYRFDLSDSPLTASWEREQVWRRETRMWTPQVQHEMLKTTHEQWVGRLNASLWHAEERGTVEFELSAEQMAEVLPVETQVVKKP